MRRVKAAVVGVGPRGYALARAAFRHPDCDLVAICDHDPDILSKTLPAFNGQVTGYCDLRQLMEEETIDIALVATPPAHHAQDTILLLSKGVNVLVECPIVETSAEAADIVDSAERNGVVVAMAESFCFFPSIQAMRKLIEGWPPSRILYGEGCYIEDDVESLSSSDWRSSLDMMRYITHGLGPLLYLAGDRAVSTMAMNPLGRKTRAEGTVLPVAMVESEKQAVFSVVNSGLAPRPLNRWSLTAEDWSVESDPSGAYTGPVRFYRRDEADAGWQTIAISQREIYGDLYGLGREPERLMIRRFIEGIQGNTMNLSRDLSLNISLTGIAASESVRLKAPVKIEGGRKNNE